MSKMMGWLSLAGAIAARLLLLVLGAGDFLRWRPEVTTPANSLLQIREGLRLLHLGLSPYSGSACHVPPLLLTLLSGSIDHGFLYAAGNIAADIVASLLVAGIAHRLSLAVAPNQRAGLWLSPSQLALLYLWNPLAIMACVSGSSAPFDNLFIMLAVFGAVHRIPPLASFGVAASAYLSLHPILLAVPVALLTAKGSEDLSLVGLSSCIPAGVGCGTGLAAPPAAGPSHDPQSLPLLPPRSSTVDVDGVVLEGDAPFFPTGLSPGRLVAAGAKPLGSSGDDCGGVAPTPLDASSTAPPSAPAAGSLAAATQEPVPTSPSRRAEGRAALQPLEQRPLAGRTVRPATCRRELRLHIAFVGWLLAWLLALAALSDISLRRFPDAQCYSLATDWLLPVASARGRQAAQHLRRPGGCWVTSCHGFLLAVEDYTPNIGLFWYFFTELFDGFRSFFRFVFHSGGALMVLPLALRLPHRPLLLVWAQLLTNSLFRPYPSVADLVPFLTLLPLLQQQLAGLRLVLLLANSLLLLLVLGPAMWHQWILIDAANSNFFYSITLLYGVWQVLLLVQMLTLTVRVDRQLAGKSMDGHTLQRPEEGAAVAEAGVAADTGHGGHGGTGQHDSCRAFGFGLGPSTQP